MAYDSPTAAVLRTMEGKDAWTASDLLGVLIYSVEFAPTRNSINLILSRLERDGRIKRVAFGVYSLPGREPHQTKMTDWIFERLRVAYPDMETAASLAKKFYARNRIRLGTERFEQELQQMRSDGLIDHFGQGRYGFFEPPPITTLPEVIDIFA